MSVAISGTTALVGAYWDDDKGTDSGSAYLFNTTTGLQIDKLIPNQGEAGDYFGVSVAICGIIAIIGADWDDDNGPQSGSAYLFDTTNSQQLLKLIPNDGQPLDLFGHSVAIGGSSGNEIAIIGALGDDDNGTDSGSAYLFNTTTGQQLAKLLANDGAVGDNFGLSVAIGGSSGKEVS